MKNKISNTFPAMIFFAVMWMPLSVHLSSFAMVSIPLLIAVWMVFVNLDGDLSLPKPLFYTFVLLCLTQLSLLSSESTVALKPMLLGLVWVGLGMVVWATMPRLKCAESMIYHSFLGASLLWSAMGIYVWLGMTDQGNPITVFGSFALTQPVDSKIIGPFANGNVFAILMLCAWCIAIAFTVRSKKYMSAYGCVSVLLLVIVCMSLSRGAWLAWSCVRVLLLLSLYQQKKLMLIVFLLLTSVAAWLCADAIVAYVNNEISMNDRVNRIIAPGVRVTLYASVIEVWKAHWLL
ncbi:MAG: hypothetical protein R8M45_08440, partial [Ghiorsea sp.]